MKRTPLYQIHLEEGGKMVPFGGWEMSVQYAGINQEHRMVREQAGVFDVSHMGQILVNGTRALEYLDSLVPADVARLDEGQIAYTQLCNERGGTIDDLLIYCLGRERYLLVVNASRIETDWEWIGGKCELPQVELENASDRMGMIALQGPDAEMVMRDLCDADLERLKYLRYVQTIWRDGESDNGLSRTGYTGEDGFEIICASGQAEKIWRDIRGKGVAPDGMGARDTLRLEMGYSLYGHELDETISPLEAGLGWSMDLTREVDFIGKQALLAQKKENKYRRMVGFIFADRGIPRAGYDICGEDGTVVGSVTSGTFSPTLEKGIGLGDRKSTR